MSAPEKLIRYRIKSGRMDVKHKTPCTADPVALACLAVERHAMNGGGSLGRIISVSGGQYTGDDTVYVSAEQICRMIGRMESVGA